VWSVAASLTCMVYSLGNISGAHLNPAVTLGVCMSRRGKCSFEDGFAYAVVQVVAAVAAALFASFLYRRGEATLGIGPNARAGWGNALVGEAFFTFLLVFVVLSITSVRAEHAQVKTRSNFFFGLTVGSCVMAGGVALCDISGGILNPAVSLGIASAGVLRGQAFTNAVFYMGAQLFGGVAAAEIFFLTHPEEFRVPAQLVKAFN